MHFFKNKISPKLFFFKFLKTFTINLIILFICLLILDLFIDKYVSKPIELSERKINLREHKPNLNTSFENIEQANEFKYAKQKINRLITDENGFIIGNVKDTLNKQIDFYFIGGSTTQCLYVDSENRFPYLVQSKLSKKFNKPVKSVNAGVGGNHMYHSILSFLSKGIDKKPKYIVILNLVNDISLLQYSGVYHTNMPSRKLINISFGHSDISLEKKHDGFVGFLRKTKDIFFPNIWLYLRQIDFKNRFSKITNKIKAKDKVNNYLDEFKGFRKNKFNNKDILSEYSKSLMTLINIAKANNISPILMTQFNMIENKHPIWIEHFNKYFDAENNWKNRNIDNYVELYSSGNNIIRDISSKENIPLIDLANLLPKKPELMFDGIHLTDEGSILVSEIIADYISKNLEQEFID